MTPTSEQVIRYLSQLGDPDQQRFAGAVWTALDDRANFVWLGWEPSAVVTVEREPPPEWYDALDAEFYPSPTSAWTPPTPTSSEAARRLAQADELHREQVLGRGTWLWLTGSLERAGERVPCCFPLFQRKIALHLAATQVFPRWLGSLQPHPILLGLGDQDFMHRAEHFVSVGAAGADESTVLGEVRSLLQTVGVHVDDVLDAGANPVAHRGEARTLLAPGCGLYLERQTPQALVPRSWLQHWASERLSFTGLAALYRTRDAGHIEPGAIAAHQVVRSSLPLNGRQREAILRLKTEPVVAVSGPPGTGKTHLVVAAAADAVARGESVLIATKSESAADAVCEVLAEHETPPFLRFGSEQHRRAVADQLSGGSVSAHTTEQVGGLEREASLAWERHARARNLVAEQLQRIQGFETTRNHPDLPLARLAPKVVSGEIDDAALEDMLIRAGVRTGWAGTRLWRRIARVIGSDETDPDLLRRAIDGARAERRRRHAESAFDSEELDVMWAELDDAERAARLAQARLDIATHTVVSPDATLSTAALATALRQPPRVAFDMLANTEAADFLLQVPFWVGTLDEIETTLPKSAAMFDLVVFDEASQIDQLAAASGLCRARRVMVVGDPRQLRHGVRVSPSALEAARHGAVIPPGPFAQLLHIGENSVFDVAAAVTPVTELDEHFRSAPHLIEFSAKRWYGDRLKLMTAHPRHEGVDAIAEIRVTGHRTTAVNEHEVAAVMDSLTALAESEFSGSVGVVTPFAEQAAALEDAAIDRLAPSTTRAMGLRIGSVHAMQGTQRDVMLVSLVIDERDFATGVLAALEDPHLFNVMITRARESMRVFHSFDPADLPQGVLSDWFRAADDATDRVPDRETTDRWTKRLADALRLGNQAVRTNYPVAGWHLDVVIGDDEHALGVETRIHPGGPDAHIERHLALRRAGWELVTALEHDWLVQEEAAAVHLAAIAAARR